MTEINKNEEWQHQVQVLIWNINQQAEFFKIRTGMSPTVFLSYNLFAKIVAIQPEAVLYHRDKQVAAHTICGYDLELIHTSTDVLYIGYRINIFDFQ